MYDDNEWRNNEIRVQITHGDEKNEERRWWLT